ncbi:MAG: hypothetical protein JNM28_04705 [Armatimonadetes bacterium]|nr:hypothetical protein [Armatimonadota bacterium]MBS1712524.1 hypothetical protein [Armatimonadota bacterium]MBX3109167.1 hypothetical protein [Fimbriimonadaceae bacterium]
MAIKPAVGDKYLYTWAQLGSPTVPGEIELPGLGKLLFDDADAYYAKNNRETAEFFIRRSMALGDGMYVVVSRRQSA